MSVQESFLKFIGQAYGLFDQLHLSVTGVIAIAIILALAFLFALREAAAWFFKIHDLKRELRTLREQNVHLEGEIHALQTLVGRLNTPPEQASPVLEPNKSTPAGASFPIVH